MATRKIIDPNLRMNNDTGFGTNAESYGGRFINKDGTFKVDRVLVGQHRVTLEGKGVPEKFASEEVTALRAEVKNGKNVFDFGLTSK